MTRFKRLTDAEARTLTRREILDAAMTTLTAAAEGRSAPDYWGTRPGELP